MTTQQFASAPRRKAAGTDASDNGRRIDLDWIRIGAFGLLILYHIALFFGPVQWHLDSRHPQQWIGSALVLTNPWRLTLLFFVSGAAVRFMSRKMQAGDLLVDRSKRLLIPFLFGVLVLVPPQAWVEDMVKFGVERGYLDYWARFFTIDRGLCLGGNCPQVPFNHLWFILYIWAYTAVVTVMLFSPRLVALIERVFARSVRGAGVLIVPVAYLCVTRIALFPSLGITNHLLSDWYNHAMSLMVFLLGFIMVDRPTFWADIEHYRWHALTAAVVTSLVLAVDAMLPMSQQHGFTVAMMTVYGINQWCMIAAILGFGSCHLRGADGPALRYLREGVFPFYLVHQTVILLVAWRLDELDLHPAFEALLLITATVAGCLATYELAKRVAFLRPVLGLRSLPPAPPAPPAPRPAQA